jgi:Putative Ig domain
MVEFSMRLMINVFKAALAVSCLAIAACGSNSSADPQSSLNSNAASASSLKAAAPATASPNGTTIPSATKITDSSGNVWTVSGGVISENGALAGYSKSVTLLLYDNNSIYQENSAGGWWSWKSSTWVASSDPRKVSSPNGTNVPSATQITDSSGNVWTVSGGVVYENGALAGYSKSVTMLIYDSNVIYQENSAGGWWSWKGGTWVSSSEPPNVPGGGGAALTISGSPSTSDVAGQAYSFTPTTTNSGGGTLAFSITNKPAWASFSTLTGELTGTPSSAQVGAYSNILISVSNGSASASLTAFSVTVTAGSASLSWTAPTENTNGTPLTDLAGYTIYYGTSPSELTQTIQVAEPSATSYVVTNLGAGTYYFAVAAYTTAATQSAQSSVGSKTIL